MLKRIVLVLVGLVVVVVVAFAVLIGSAFAGQKKADTATLTDGAQPILDGYVAAFAIPTDATGNRVILVDCGNDKDGKALKAALGSKTVAAIFLTHGHPDHVNGCHQFPGAPIYAGKDEIPMLTGQAAWDGPLPHLFGAKDSGVRATPLEDNADVVVDGIHVHAFALPGHTKGSMAYAILKTVYFGDAASCSSDNKVVRPVRAFSDDAALGAESLRALPGKLAAAHVDGIDTYAFAHSGSVKADPALLSNVQ